MEFTILMTRLAFHLVKVSMDSRAHHALPLYALRAVTPETASYYPLACPTPYGPVLTMLSSPKFVPFGNNFIYVFEFPFYTIVSVLTLSLTEVRDGARPAMAARRLKSGRAW
jgi:hypothetical protein